MNKWSLSRRVTVPLYAVAGAALAVAALGVAVWSMKRRRRANIDLDEGAALADLVPSLVGATHASLLDGNEIELLENGRFFDVLLAELKAARQSITLETFLWKPGKLSQRIVDVLVAKAREGVAVRVLVDGAGRKISRSEMHALRDAGCRVGRYHPFNLVSFGLMNNRDHRKIAVVDGQIGFIGGHCIVDTWLGEARENKVRDISVRVRGPVVGELQSAFLENWLETTGEVLAGDRFFPNLSPCGDVKAHLVYISPAHMASSVEVLHYVAIAAAQKSIRVQNPYFVPDPQAVRALVAAVERGVDVQIMVPSVSASDNAIVQHASHHRFGALLEGGVRIFEYGRSLLHQKVMTIDGVWSSVGSTNFDDRSFELNDEATLGIFEERIAHQLEQIFERDRKHCSEYTLDAWKKRSVRHKLTDAAAFAVNEQL